MEKQVSIVVAASGEVKDVALSPGATVKEVLSEAGLQGYQLSRKGGEPLSPDTDLYEDASDSEKLYATPCDVSVGGGGSASLLSFLNYLRTRRNYLKERIVYFLSCIKKIRFSRSKRVRLLGIRSMREPDYIVALPGKHEKRARVTGRDRSSIYWQENGWKKISNEYKGYYKTNFGKWRGLIKENFLGNYSYFIFNPPSALKDTSHWECFTHRGNGSYSVHFSKKPKDISSGIITIEQLLAESFGQQ